MLDTPALLANKSDAQFKAALEHLLAAHTLPVFGAAKQVEHEVAALTVNLDLPPIPLGNPWCVEGMLTKC